MLLLFASKIGKILKYISLLVLFSYILLVITSFFTGEFFMIGIIQIRDRHVPEIMIETIDIINVFYNFTLLFIIGAFLEKYHKWVKNKMNDFPKEKEFIYEELEMYIIPKALTDNVLRKIFLIFNKKAFLLSLLMIILELINRLIYIDMNIENKPDVFGMILLSLITVVFWSNWNKTAKIEEEVVKEII